MQYATRGFARGLRGGIFTTSIPASARTASNDAVNCPDPPHLHQAYLDAERRRASVAQLTPRQTDLLRLVADGHTNAQIARRLGLSEGTVRTHLENIYGRLQVSSRTAAVLRAFPDRLG